MAAENISSLLDVLPNTNDPVSSLLELKGVLCSVHPTTLSEVVPSLSFHVVFEFLNSQKRDQVEVCCDVLSRLLNGFQPDVLLQTFQAELTKCLLHPMSSVQLFSLSQLARVGSCSVEALVTQPELIQRLVQLIHDEKLDVSDKAGKILTHLGRVQSGLQLLYSGQVFLTIQELMTRSSDIVRFRMYQVLINICQLSPLALDATSQSGLLQQLTSEVYKKDILLQLNCIELLSSLALSDHGLLFLDQQGIVGKLQALMNKGDTDPLAGLLLPALMKFFGTMARQHPKEVFGQHKDFVNILFGRLSSQDVIAAQTVCFIGETVGGKLALNKLGSQMDQGVQCIGRLMRSSPDNVRVQVMQSAAGLLRLQVSDQTEELLKVTECWFSLLPPKPFDWLMSACQQPFLTVRCAAHEIFQSIAAQPWGQSLMNNYPGFKEYLLDRSTETSKEGKDSKYEIIKLLVESGTVSEQFGAPYYVRLKEYLNNGPFHVRVQAEVAYEQS